MFFIGTRYGISWKRGQNQFWNDLMTWWKLTRYHQWDYFVSNFSSNQYKTILLDYLLSQTLKWNRKSYRVGVVNTGVGDWESTSLTLEWQAIVQLNNKFEIKNGLYFKPRTLLAHEKRRVFRVILTPLPSARV